MVSVITLNLLLMASQKYVISSFFSAHVLPQYWPQAICCRLSCLSFQDVFYSEVWSHYSSFMLSTGATMGKWFSSCKKHSRLSCNPEMEEKYSDRSVLCVRRIHFEKKWPIIMPCEVTPITHLPTIGVEMYPKSWYSTRVCYEMV
jgi:hypothetical protein